MNNRALIIALGILVAAVLVMPVLGGMMMGPGIMWPGMMGGYGAPGSTPAVSGWVWGLGMALGWLMMFAFWGALIISVGLVVRWLAGSARSARTGEDAPGDVLRRRYAAGEITREQYEQMRQVLDQAA